MRFAVLFPGQGSQFVGMGADVFDARPDLLGSAANGILGWSLRDLCLEGPQEELTRTEHAQPALYAVSYALWEEFSRVLRHAPQAGAGHSLGEYTALAASGAISYEDGLRLVAERGRAMALAADAAPSGMAALVGADEAQADALASARRDDGGSLWVANVNAPGQVVVAGGSDDLEWAAAHAADHGIRRAIPLDVAGAFHSPFMAPAAEQLKDALAGTSFTEPAFPVWANVTALPHEADHIPALLGTQLTGTVRFAASLRGIAAHGTNAFVHVGPGDVTAGLARRSVEGTEAFVVSSLEEAGAVAAGLVE